ncbi:hypothetical protein H0H93_005584, partial [Arthromyces matolae]
MDVGYANGTIVCQKCPAILLNSFNQTAPGSTQPPSQIPPVVHLHGIDFMPFTSSQSPPNEAKSGVSRTDPATTTSTIAGVAEPADRVLLQRTVNRLEREIADMQALLH